jgi:5-methylcytosine-specific restriction endonuclease McrA
MVILVLLIIGLGGLRLKWWLFELERKRRREYYRDVYLKSDAWMRKRYVVLKRDNWRCVYCGERATQVHHKKYAKINIGKEPIKWLVSVCKNCHESIHH